MHLIRCLVTLACVFAVSPVLARHSRNFHHQKNIHVTHHPRSFDGEADHIVSHPSGCPRIAFCGCGVSVKVFGHPVRSLFLASNWFRFPRAIPGPGMVAVRNHHVMLILAYDANGNATVYDPNSGGHLTRIHQHTLAGYRIVNPNSYASASTIHSQYGPRDITGSL